MELFERSNLSTCKVYKFDHCNKRDLGMKYEDQYFWQIGVNALITIIVDMINAGKEESNEKIVDYFQLETS